MVHRTKCAVVVVVCLCLSSVIAGTNAGLTLTKECGEIQCKSFEYCSQFGHHCQPCSDICREDSHNYQQERCEQQCQDYLHDIQYLRRNATQRMVENQLFKSITKMEKEIEMLLIFVSVIFAVMMLIVFGGVFFFLSKQGSKFLRRKKTADVERCFELKRIGEKLSQDYAQRNPVISPKSNTVPIYPLDRTPSSAGYPGYPVKKEPLPLPLSLTPRRRHPSEDTCPGEYEAYDNPALSVTPPPAGASPHAGSRLPNVVSLPTTPTTPTTPNTTMTTVRESDVENDVTVTTSGRL